MKKILIVGCCAIPLILFFYLTTFDRQYPYDVEEIIWKLNKNYPYKMKYGELTSIKLENGYIVFNTKIDSDYIDIDALNSNPEESRDMLFLAMKSLEAQDSNFKKLINLVKSKNIGFKYVLTNSFNESFTAEMSTEYIAEMHNKTRTLSPSEAAYCAIKEKYDLLSNGRPILIFRGAYLTGVDYNSYDGVILDIDINDTLYDLSSIWWDQYNLTHRIIEDANYHESILTSIFVICKASHTGIILRLHGIQSNETIDVEIASTLIRNEFITPQHLNIN